VTRNVKCFVSKEECVIARFAEVIKIGSTNSWPLKRECENESAFLFLSKFKFGRKFELFFTAKSAGPTVV